MRFRLWRFRHLDERADHGTEAARAYPDRQSPHKARSFQQVAEVSLDPYSVYCACEGAVRFAPDRLVRVNAFRELGTNGKEKTPKLREPTLTQPMLDELFTFL
jgi:hypothetical protein